VTAQATPFPGADERLRDVQALTDAALSLLDDDALLTELIQRTRDILQADTAAVLLLDPRWRQLLPVAAAGLEEEVRQGVRIPVGRGFAGRIAAERRPVILDRVDHTTVLNPILWNKRIQSLVGVPLIAGGDIIGVMHVGSLTPRRFTSEETVLLQLAADRAAAAVRSMQGRVDRAAVTALQRGLLPGALPDIAGTQMAARYVAGNGVLGGDWYDVFTLDSGELCVVMGDVAGSGMAAAVVMGRMRSALRAYALETDDPADVLSRLDRKMNHFEPDALATVLYAIIEPGTGQVRISCAGHLPPVIAVPGEQAKLAEVASDVMIGVDPGMRRHVTTLDLAPATSLCFYTDGLVERPDKPIDDGLARLCQAMTADHPETACALVMAAMVGSVPTRDDIALLIARRTSPGTPGGAGPLGWPPTAG
jgi:serine phosphatase RsbU (regulator of sigma subunit)